MISRVRRVFDRFTVANLLDAGVELVTESLHLLR